MAGTEKKELELSFEMSKHYIYIHSKLNMKLKTHNN